jgi:hypothetical protein
MFPSRFKIASVWMGSCPQECKRAKPNWWRRKLLVSARGLNFMLYLDDIEPTLLDLRN